MRRQGQSRSEVCSQKISAVDFLMRLLLHHDHSILSPTPSTIIIKCPSRHSWMLSVLIFIGYWHALIKYVRGLVPLCELQNILSIVFRGMPFLTSVELHVLPSSGTRRAWSTKQTPTPLSLYPKAASTPTPNLHLHKTFPDIPNRSGVSSELSLHPVHVTRTTLMLFYNFKYVCLYLRQNK